MLCLNVDVEHFYLDGHKAHCDGFLSQLVHSTLKRPNQYPQTWVDVHFILVQMQWFVNSFSILLLYLDKVSANTMFECISKVCHPTLKKINK